MTELVGIVEDGGVIDKEDADLLVQKIKDEHKSAKAPRILPNDAASHGLFTKIKAIPKPASKQTSTMSHMPRWGALTFEEKIENDMVANRMKDPRQTLPDKNFVK